MKRYLLYILVFFTITSCEELYDLEPAEETPDLIVVDGIITNEKTRHEIKISLPSASINVENEPVKGAIVFISNEDTTFLLSESNSKPGVYLTDSIRCYTGKNYQLSISYKGQSYLAITKMIPVSPFVPLTFAKKNSTENLYYALPYLGSEEPAMFEIIADWRHIGPMNENDTIMMARILYYNLKTIDVPEVFAAGQETVFFPAGTIITEKKYSLNDTHAAFLRSLLLESAWTGGNFDATHANLLTNLSDGAIGYFGACNVLVDTIYVTP